MVFSNIVATCDQDTGFHMMGHMDLFGVTVLTENITSDVDSIMIFADESKTDEDPIDWTVELVQRLL